MSEGRLLATMARLGLRDTDEVHARLAARPVADKVALMAAAYDQLRQLPREPYGPLMDYYAGSLGQLDRLEYLMGNEPAGETLTDAQASQLAAVTARLPGPDHPLFPAFVHWLALKQTYPLDNPFYLRVAALFWLYDGPDSAERCHRALEATETAAAADDLSFGQFEEKPWEALQYMRLSQSLHRYATEPEPSPIIDALRGAADDQRVPTPEEAIEIIATVRQVAVTLQPWVREQLLVRHVSPASLALFDRLAAYLLSPDLTAALIYDNVPPMPPDLDAEVEADEPLQQALFEIVVDAVESGKLREAGLPERFLPVVESQVQTMKAARAMMSDAGLEDSPAPTGPVDFSDPTLAQSLAHWKSRGRGGGDSDGFGAILIGPGLVLLGIIVMTGGNIVEAINASDLPLEQKTVLFLIGGALVGAGILLPKVLRGTRHHRYPARCRIAILETWRLLYAAGAPIPTDERRAVIDAMVRPE